MTPPFDSSAMSSAEKDALIATLLARIDELSKRVAALEKENAALRAKLKLPPKTPDNSSTPPARGQKGSDTTPSQPKRPRIPAVRGSTADAPGAGPRSACRCGRRRNPLRHGSAARRRRNRP